MRAGAIAVEFDGAFRDVLVFVNGCFIGRNDNGYAPFRFDITDFLAVGAKNCIVVRVDASFGDGWFYEGAGIYRHVWLTKTDPLHLGRWESCVRASDDAATAPLVLNLATQVENEGKRSGDGDGQLADSGRRRARPSRQPKRRRSRSCCDADARASSTTAQIDASDALVRRHAQSLHRHRHRQDRRQGRAMPSASPLACARCASMPITASS